MALNKFGVALGWFSICEVLNNCGMGWLWSDLACARSKLLQHGIELQDKGVLLEWIFLKLWLYCEGNCSNDKDEVLIRWRGIGLI